MKIVLRNRRKPSPPAARVTVNLRVPPPPVPIMVSAELAAKLDAHRGGISRRDFAERLLHRALLRDCGEGLSYPEVMRQWRIDREIGKRQPLEAREPQAERVKQLA